MHIYVINGSTLVTDAQAAAMTAAVEQQVIRHLAPAYGLRSGPEVTFLAAKPKRLPAYVLTLVDKIDDQPAGVLGYHTEETGGTQFAVVAAGPVLNAGQQVLTGDWSVSSVLSHEVCEWLVDPACNKWAAARAGRWYTYEACDAVEAPTYIVTSVGADAVSVSNFVLPAWFDPQSPAGAKLDWLGLVTKPFGILPGGYAVYADASGEHQKFGEEFPEWRRAMKSGPHARTQRRVVQGEHLGF
jgi:hypothetical protein